MSNQYLKQRLKGYFPPPSIPGVERFGFFYNELRTQKMRDYLDALEINSEQDELNFYRYLSKYENKLDRESLIGSVTGRMFPIMSEEIFAHIDNYYNTSDEERMYSDLEYFEFHGLNFSVLLKYFNSSYKKWKRLKKNKDYEHFTVIDYNDPNYVPRLTCYIPDFDGVQEFSPDGELIDDDADLSDLPPNYYDEPEFDEDSPNNFLGFESGHENQDPTIEQNFIDDRAIATEGPPTLCSVNQYQHSADEPEDCIPLNKLLQLENFSQTLHYEKVAAGATNMFMRSDAFNYDKTVVTRYRRTFIQNSIQFKTITFFLASGIDNYQDLRNIVLPSEIRNYWKDYTTVDQILSVLRHEIQSIQRRTRKVKRQRDRTDLKMYKKVKMKENFKKRFVVGDEIT